MSALIDALGGTFWSLLAIVVAILAVWTWACWKR